MGRPTKAELANAIERFCIEWLESRKLLASAAFLYDPVGGGPPHELQFVVDAAQVPSDANLTLTNRTTGDLITNYNLSINGATATVTFPGYSNGVVSGVLPDGNYYAVLVDPSAPLDQDVLGKLSFFVLTADANHDRTINALDFNALATNYGQSNRTFSQGDFNYDGTVNSADFALLSAKYGSVLAPTTPGPVTNLQATFSNNQVLLDWDDSTEPNVTYDVYRTLNPEYIDDPTNDLIAQGLTQSQFTDTTFTADTNYSYFVTAVDQQSYPSGPAFVYTGSAAAPNNVFAADIDENAVQLTWNDRSNGEDHFVVQELENGVWTDIANRPQGCTHYTIEDLSEQTDYSFRVGAEYPDNSLYISDPANVTTAASGDKVGMIIIVLGHNQRVSNFNPSLTQSVHENGHGGLNLDEAGLNQLAFELRHDPDQPFFNYDNHGNNVSYRVRVISESDSDTPDIQWNGAGNPASGTDDQWVDDTTYDHILNDIRNKGIQDVAVMGYSHGGALARRIVNRLNQDHTFTDFWNVTYSAYVDAIRRDGTFDDNPFTGAETRRPMFSGDVNNVNESYYNTEPIDLIGNPYQGAPIANSGNFAFSNDSHFTIDNDVNVHAGIIQSIRNYITS